MNKGLRKLLTCRIPRIGLDVNARHSLVVAVNYDGRASKPNEAFRRNLSLLAEMCGRAVYSLDEDGFTAKRSDLDVIAERINRMLDDVKFRPVDDQGVSDRVSLTERALWSAVVTTLWVSQYGQRSVEPEELGEFFSLALMVGMVVACLTERSDVDGRTMSIAVDAALRRFSQNDPYHRRNVSQLSIVACEALEDAGVAAGDRFGLPNVLSSTFQEVINGFYDGYHARYNARLTAPAVTHVKLSADSPIICGESTSDAAEVPLPVEIVNTKTATVSKTGDMLAQVATPELQAKIGAAIAEHKQEAAAKFKTELDQGETSAKESTAPAEAPTALTAPTAPAEVLAPPRPHTKAEIDAEFFNINTDPRAASFFKGESKRGSGLDDFVDKMIEHEKANTAQSAPAEESLHSVIIPATEPEYEEEDFFDERETWLDRWQEKRALRKAQKRQRKAQQKAQAVMKSLDPITLPESKARSSARDMSAYDVPLPLEPETESSATIAVASAAEVAPPTPVVETAPSQPKTLRVRISDEDEVFTSLRVQF